MRLSILVACALLTCGALSARTFQPTHRFILGINGGISTTSIPKFSKYTGTNSTWAPYVSIKADYTLSDHFEIGIDAGGTRWKTYDRSWHIIGPENQSYGDQKVTYNFADAAIHIAPRFNVLFPLYSQYRYFNKATIYAGGTFGAVFTINDGGIIYKTTNGTQYTSQVNMAAGTGFIAGVQVGYTHYFSDLFGVNAEFAPKYANVKTVDPRYGGGNEHYMMFYFPFTVGLRFRL